MKWNEPSSLSACSRLLCISGTHGCGKTFLASSIIEDLKSKQLQTIFFYFSGKEENLKSLNGLVRTFLWQFLDYNTDQRSLELISGLALKGPPAFTDMVHVLKEVSSLVTGPIYCVIDGVDECVGECDDSSRKLFQLVLGLLNANANCRVVLLGRQHVLQRHVLQAAFSAMPERIEISSDLVRQDINAFIGAEIDAKINSDLLRLPGLRDSISKTLQEKSGGMFLWVELMIKDLSRSDSQFEVEERLRNPPRTLEGIYRHLFLRLMKRLDKIQLNLAKKILCFIITSCRTLEVSELQHALALDSGSIKFKEHLLLHPAQSILDVCGDFINIRDGLVQLAHFSVQEFLTRPEDEWHSIEDGEIVHFLVDLGPSHRSLGFACIDYLGICDYGYPLSDTDAFLKLAKDYPFMRYASRYAISHLNQSGPLCSVTVRKISDFLASEKFAYWIEYLAMLVLEDGSIIMLVDEFRVFISRLDMEAHERNAFSNDLRMRLNQELQRRIRLFGEQDPRTEQWQSFLYIMGHQRLDGDVEENGDLRFPNQVPRIRPMEELSLSSISNALIHNPIIPLHRQIDMLVRLTPHLWRVRVLTDPLKILFRAILQKSHVVPVYLLWAIGDFYRRLDKLDDALEIYRVAFAKVETEETIIKFEILGCIGDVFDRQEQYAEAEASFRRCLRWDERVLGEEHKNTMRDLYDLADVLRKQQKYMEAEGFYRRCLKGEEKLLGKDHRYTLVTLYYLADVLRTQQKYMEAEVFYRRCLKGEEKVLGKDHQHTLMTLYWLADVLRSQGKYSEAREVEDNRGEVLTGD